MNIKRNRLCALFILCGIFWAPVNLVATNYPTIPDNSSARRLMQELTSAPISQISVSDGRIIEDGFSGNLVKFEVQRQQDKLYLLFINQRQQSFPIVGAGNMVIRRSLDDGGVEQLKVFLDDIGALVLRIAPSGSRSRLSLSLFDDVLYSNLPISQPVERIMQMQIDEIVELASGRVDWAALFPHGNVENFDHLVNILNRMRGILPYLPDADDGAMDENGNLVRIETLKTNNLPGFNCSGFAKYLSDGIFVDYAGHYMGIEELKIKHSEYRGTDITLEYEDLRDPYFGLDWTRNIAVTIARAQGLPISSPEDMDVRDVPWFDYREDMGYPVDDLVSVMYLQAIQDPGKLYLGSINGEFGADPVLWQHYHVVVLFPHFDADGNFRISVLERNVETSASSLQRRYSGQFIHLVSIAPGDEFHPQQIAGISLN